MIWLIFSLFSKDSSMLRFWLECVPSSSLSLLSLSAYTILHLHSSYVLSVVHFFRNNLCIILHHHFGCFLDILRHIVPKHHTDCRSILEANEQIVLLLVGVSSQSNDDGKCQWIWKVCHVIQTWLDVGPGLLRVSVLVDVVIGLHLAASPNNSTIYRIIVGMSELLRSMEPGVLLGLDQLLVLLVVLVDLVPVPFETRFLNDALEIAIDSTAALRTSISSADDISLSSDHSPSIWFWFSVSRFPRKRTLSNSSSPRGKSPRKPPQSRGAFLLSASRSPTRISPPPLLQESTFH